MKKFWKVFKSYLYILLAILCATVGLNAFLIPNGFFDGGVMGISLLFKQIFGWNLSVLIVTVNLPFIVLSARQLSLKFALRSVMAITLLALSVQYFRWNAVTTDPLLVSVFGGFFLGLGIGLAIRGSSVIDGAEILAIYTSRKMTFSVGEIIALFNFILFGLVAVIVDVQSAMYSMLTYFAASRTVDFVINGIEEYIGVTVISAHDEKIKSILTHELGRGVTVYKTEGGYGKGGKQQERNALFCILTRLEVPRILSEIDRIDPKAFVFQQTIRDTRGGMLRKRKLHQI